MNRTCKGVAAALTAAAVSMAGATAADAASTSPAARVSAQDAAFLKSNEQVNLAEITLATIMLKRSHTEHGRALATTTKRDHLKAQAKLKVVAKADGVVLPTAPNAMQQKVAAALRTAKLPNFAYFTAQIPSHKLSIAQTKTEINKGSKANVVSYAKYYLPVAQMHLAMSKDDLARWHRYN